MKDIVFLCGGGFSSSTVVNHMKKVAQKRQLDVNIFWGSAGALFDHHDLNTCFDEKMDFENIGVILLTPHLRPYLEFIKKAAPKNVPVHMIDGRLYGDIDGLLDSALQMMNAGVGELT